MQSGMEMLEPDVLATSEFDDFRTRAALDRERLLMYAVLEDALSCYRQYAGSRLPRTRQLYVEAREWVASEDRTSLFAFESICDALDMDADVIRGRLRALDARACVSRKR